MKFNFTSFFRKFSLINYCVYFVLTFLCWNNTGSAEPWRSKKAFSINYFILDFYHNYVPIATCTADAGSDDDACGFMYTLNGSAPDGGETGVWSKTTGSGNATFTPNANDPDATVTVDAYDTYTFTWTITEAPLCLSSDDVTINFYQQPTANAGSGGDECDLTFDLNATPSVGTGVWTHSGPGNENYIPNANDPDAIVTVDSYGSYTFTWTETNGSCPPDGDDITVNFYQQPVADAGNGGDECDLDFNLNANPSVGIGVWSQTSGSGTATFTPNANDPDAIVTVDAYDTYTFKWTETNGTCTDDADVIVNFYEQPIADAGSGGNECDFTFDLSATLSSGAGVWSKTTGSGNATFTPNANDPAATVTVDAYDTYTFTWTETNGTCTDDADVIVNFYEQPIADAGSGGNECDFTFDLNATLSSGAGVWSKTTGSGNATFTPNANDPAATVTVDAYDTYTFTWTETNGTCTDDADVIVNFYEQPIADAGSGGNECDFTFDLNATLSSGAGVWSKTTGSGNATFTPNANDPAATVTVDAYDTYTFTWTETNGTCSDDDDITVNFYEQPVADAGNGGDECDLDFNLDANPSVGIGAWSQTGGSGTATFTPNVNDPDAIVTVDAYDTYTFKWTETNGTCSDDDDITVNFYEQPVANAGNGGDECDLDFNLDANPSVGIGVWSQTSGSGTATFTPNANDPDAIVTVDAYDTYTFKWTETNGTCPTNDDDITVNFYEQPTADAGTGGNECDLTFNLNATTPLVGTGDWMISMGTGSAMFDPDETTPNAIATVDEYGEYIFAWTVTNGTCTDVDYVTINFNEPPTVSCPADLTVCEIVDPFNLTGESPSGGIYSCSGISTSPEFDPDLAGVGTHMVMYNYTDMNGCEGMCTFNITVTEAPFYSSTTSLYYCTFADALAATDPGDDISLEAGTYNDCITVDKSISITASSLPVILTCLTMDGVGEDLSLGSDLTITTLTLTNGKIHTNGNNLSVGTISGGSTDSYVVTD